MLWLHFGMPKTGTTSLQGFIRGNRSALSEAGLRYMETGRSKIEGGGRLTISHNRLVFHINQTKLPMDDYRAAMFREYEAHGDKTCLVSSEMFYTANLKKLAEVFADIPPSDIRVMFYCRRYSDFFEAEFKQRAKNGRLPGDGTAFVKSRLQAIEQAPERHSFRGAVSRVREAFPGVQITPVIYDREEMKNGNVVDDFLSRLELDLPNDLSTQTPANPSLSRAASEAFGVVTRAYGRKQSRQLRRKAVTDPVMFRRHDVLEPAEREHLDDFLGRFDTSFQQEFFPERPTLFTPPNLTEQDLAFRRDTPEEYAALKRASEIVFRMALEG